MSEGATMLAPRKPSMTQPRTFWPIGLVCPRCQCPELEMLAPPGRRDRTLRLAAVWRCVDCESEYIVNIEMSTTAARARHGSKDEPVCGTERGYHRHRHLGTPRCDACKKAHSDHNRAGPSRAAS